MSSLPLTHQKTPVPSATPQLRPTTPWWPWPLALLLWLALLWGVGFLLAAPHPVAPPPAPLDAQLIELPPPPAPPKPQVVTPPQPVHTVTPRSVTPPIAPVTQPTPPLPKVALASSPAADPPPAKADPAPPTPPTPPSPPSPPSPPPAPPAPPAPAAKGPAGTAQMGARALYQPKPVLPESLRDSPIHVTVLARFHIQADGSARVELTQPAPDPRINQLILNTLKTWRFFPAIESGKPVASTLDISLPIDVE